MCFVALHFLKHFFSKVKLVILAAVLFIAVRGGAIRRCCAEAANSLAVCVKKVAIFKHKGGLRYSRALLAILYFGLLLCRPQFLKCLLFQ